MTSSLPPLSEILRPPTHMNPAAPLNGLWNSLAVLAPVEGSVPQDAGGPGTSLAEAFLDGFLKAASDNGLECRIEKEAKESAALVLRVTGEDRSFTITGQTQPGLLAEFIHMVFGPLCTLQLLNHHDLITHTALLTPKVPTWLEDIHERSRSVFDAFVKHLACWLPIMLRSLTVEKKKTTIASIAKLFGSSKFKDDFKFELVSDPCEDRKIEATFWFYAFKCTARASTQALAVKEALLSYNPVRCESTQDPGLPAKLINDFGRFDEWKPPVEATLVRETSKKSIKMDATGNNEQPAEKIDSASCSDDQRTAECKIPHENKDERIVSKQSSPAFANDQPTGYRGKTPGQDLAYSHPEIGQQTVPSHHGGYTSSGGALEGRAGDGGPHVGDEATKSAVTPQASHSTPIAQPLTFSYERLTAGPTALEIRPKSHSMTPPTGSTNFNVSAAADGDYAAVPSLRQYDPAVWENGPRWTFLRQAVLEYIPLECPTPYLWSLDLEVTDYPGRASNPKVFRISLTRLKPDGSKVEHLNRVTRPTLTQALYAFLARLRNAKRDYADAEHCQRYLVRRILQIPQDAPDDAVIRLIISKSKETRLGRWFTEFGDYGLWGICRTRMQQSSDPAILADPQSSLAFLQTEDNLFLFFLCLNFILDARDYVPLVCAGFEDIDEFLTNSWNNINRKSRRRIVERFAVKGGAGGKKKMKLDTDG